MKKIILIFTFFVFCFSANATVLFVSQTGNNSNNGYSWATAKSSIQSAIDSAQRGDSVFVAIGNFGGFTVNSGIHIYGGFLGYENHLYQRQPLNFGFLSNNTCTKIQSAIYTIKGTSIN